MTRARKAIGFDSWRPHDRPLSKARILIAMLLAIAVAALLIARAKAHEWYPPVCCSDRDCREVQACALPNGQMGLAYSPGECTAIDWSKVQRMPSPDGQWHACLGPRLIASPPQVRCIFAAGQV